MTVVTATAKPIRPLADDFVTVYESPDPKSIYTYSPGITRLDNGRLVATIDLGGPGMKDWREPKGFRYDQPKQGKVFASDEGGATWTHRADFPFMYARPFVAGESLYVLGQAEDLMIIRSDDGGATWGAPARLTDGEDWTQAPCNVHYANGCVYLVMNKRPYPHQGFWPVSVEAPVLMRARLGDDLTRRESWTFGSTLAFRDIVTPERLDWFGVPFFESFLDRPTFPAPGRAMAPIGWLETHVVQYTDPHHLWHDPTGKTFHLWSRAHTGGTGYAAIAKVVEQGDRPGTGEMITQLETVPSGKTILYVPCPGGQMKFHVLYIDGDDLVVLSRSGDERAKTPHDGNLIGFHRVKEFRRLVY